MTSVDVRDLVRRLEVLGCSIRAQGSDLAVSAPKDALTLELREELKASKAALLTYLTQARGPVRGVRDGPVPLGPVQRRMWMMDQLDTDSSVLNLAGAWRLSGSLDSVAFVAAFEEVVRRHDVLRTHVLVEEGEPFQVLGEGMEDCLQEVDLTTLHEDERDSRMMALIQKTRDVPFDLTRPPLFRALLIRLDADEHVFAFVPHHIIWDGWCWDILHGELAALYPALSKGQPSPLSDLPFQYADFAQWHRARMEGPELDRQLEFWRSALDVGLEPLRFSQSADAGHRKLSLAGPAERRVLEFAKDDLERLTTVAREERATLFMALLAAWAIWLQRATGQGAFGVGIPIQDRIHPGTEELLGAMVNTIVVPVRIRAADSFRSVLRAVRNHSLAAYDHQDLPYERLVQELADVLPGRAALFQTLFSYQDVRNRPCSIGDLRLSQIHVDAGVGDTDVGCGFMVTEERTVALLDFRKALFSPTTASRMAAGYRELVRDASLHPDTAVGRLTVVAGDNRTRSLEHLFGGGETIDAESEVRASLTPHQEGIWFIDELAPGTSVHHLAERVRMQGRLDRRALADAWRALLDRHDVLRLRAPGVHGYPELRESTSPPELESLSAVDASQAVSLLDARFREAFDIKTGPLCRLTAIQCVDPEAWYLQVTCHNLVADERSLSVLLAELGRLYSGETLGDAPTSFAALSEKERERSESPEARKHLDWWMEAFREKVPSLTLPTDLPREPAVVRPADSLALDLGDEVRSDLPAFAAGIGVAEGPVLLAAWSLALSRSSGASAFRLGLVVPSLARVDVHDAVGPLQKTVLLSVAPGEADTFAALCREIHHRLTDVLAHSDVPFERIVAETNPSRTLGSNPLYQAQVILSNHTPGAFRIPDDLEFLPIRREAIHGDLSLRLNAGGAGGWVAQLDFASDLFGRATAARWIEQFAFALERGIQHPDAPLATSSRMPDGHRAWLEQSGTGPTAPVSPSVVEAVQHHAETKTKAGAVTGRGVTLTYGDLWARSGEVAGELVARGVTPGAIVGVCTERHAEMVVALLGIWRAGAAYLPLDPEFPADRLSFMVSDSGVRRVVTDGRVEIPEMDVDVVFLSEVGELRDMRLVEPRADDLAYVIYTSGSTGRPKGVEVRHGNLSNLIHSMARAPGLYTPDVLLAVTTLSFDIAGLELWLPLTMGARVEIADEDEVRDGEWLMERLDESGATIVQATPSTWRMLLDAGWEGRLAKVLCGGEAFPKELVEPLLDRADEVWNLYGPTETTIWSTAHRVEEEGAGSVPIGRPIENTQIYVMDPEGRLTPPGVPGELWIGGHGVAGGYRNRPDLTTERFVANPFREGERLYRTGDLARWRNDGLLEHLGRMDHQVKVHGHRIELGEIEAALVAHEAIRQAVVTVHGTGPDARLVAYVVLSAGQGVLASEVRRFLADRLPGYMLPGGVVELDAIPLTPNGKVNRNALTDPTAESVRTAHRPPEGVQEQGIARIWKELLSLDRVGRDDNFFELGGHSLLAIRSVAQLAEEEGLRLDPRSLFFMTLEQVAESANLVPDGVPTP